MPILGDRNLCFGLGIPLEVRIKKQKSRRAFTRRLDNRQMMKPSTAWAPRFIVAIGVHAHKRVTRQRQGTERGDLPR